jgi:hypothetical protein
MCRFCYTKEEFFVSLENHSHEQKFENCKNELLRAEIKERALTISEKPKYIFNKFFSGDAQQVILNHSKAKTICERITKTRKANRVNVKTETPSLIPTIFFKALIIKNYCSTKILKVIKNVAFFRHTTF